MQDFMKLLGVGLQASIALLVLAVGLRTTWSDVTYLFRRPQLLLRSIVARNVLVPVATVLLVLAMRPEPIIGATLLALSVAAVPPILPRSLMRAGGGQAYVIGLLTSQTTLAILLVPLSLSVFDALFGWHARFAAMDIVPIMLKLTIFPLAIGMILRLAFPERSDTASASANSIATILLFTCAVAALVITGPAVIALIGDGTLLAMVLLVLIGLAAGHWLGGPRAEDRKSLALASASAHPGLAIAIVSTSAAAADSGIPIVLAAVLLYLVVRMLVTLPYARRVVAKETVWPTVHRTGQQRRSKPRPGQDRRGAGRATA